MVATQPQTKRNLSLAAYNQKNVAEASVVIVVCADEALAQERYGERGRTLYCIQDTAAAVQNILLAAYALGLGTCWVGAFIEDQVRKAINAPVNMRPVALIPVGYPAEPAAARSRRPLGKIMREESF